ncbi:hypothetical protein ACEN8K_47685, partial [Variovorax sp. CT11-76]
RRAGVRLRWLPAEEAGAEGDVAARLDAFVDPSRYRIDVREAPMIHAIAAHDAARGRAAALAAGRRGWRGRGRGRAA